MVPSSYFFPSRLSSLKPVGTGRTNRASMWKRRKVFQIFLETGPVQSDRSVALSPPVDLI